MAVFERFDMRWKAAKIGDTRIRKWFLLIPWVINGKWVWLERVAVKQEYVQQRVFDPKFGLYRTRRWWVALELELM